MKFTDLGLHPTVMAGVEANHYEECTPVQEKAIPYILEGKDLAGLAQTGTGKTAAFVLPLIDRIVRSKEASKNENLPGVEGASSEGSSNEETPQVAHPIFKDWRLSHFILVLVPTRELAEQVYENVAKFGKAANIRATAIYGGTGYEAQKAAIKKGVEFIVATPGRLIDLYKENQVDFSLARAVVFDEADRMFDMGFKDDMKYILRRVPQDRQFLVFSATLNFDVLNTAYEFGANPIEVNVSRDQAKAENVKDYIFHVGQDDKAKFLLSILRKHKPKQTIIFSNFKYNVERVAKFLSANGVPAMGISSLISQNQRTRVMDLFRTENNDQNVLVATDVAARGLDIKGVDMVVNYELPDDAENYVHRIGRTGRAGASGQAYSLVSDRDVEALQRIETYLGHKVEVGWLDDADLVQEFKPVPRDEERGRRDFRQDSGGSRPRHSGGGRREPRESHSRNGRSSDFQSRDRQGPHHKSQNRPQQNAGQKRPHEHGGAQQSGPRREHSAHGRRDHHQERYSKEGRPQHSSRPRMDGDVRKQHNHASNRDRHHHKPTHLNQAQRNDSNRMRSFKHKPQVEVANPNMISTIAGFFKKLFGGPKSATSKHHTSSIGKKNDGDKK